MEWKEVGPPELVLEHDKIGGSSLGILMGLAGYGGTPLDVFNRIVHKIVDHRPNPYTERGNKYEPVVRGLFVERTGAKLLPHPGIVFLEDCFAITLDDLAQRGSGPFAVDYKTASNSKSNMRKWGPDGSDQFPPQYRAQLMLYTAVLNRMKLTTNDTAELFVAFGTDVLGCSTENPCQGRHKCHTGEFTITETRRYFYRRDLKLEEEGLGIGRKFWREHILTKIPPRGDDSSENLTEVLNLNLSKEDMDIFDLAMATASAPPPPPEPVAPPPPLQKAVPVVYGACPDCKGEVTNINGSKRGDKVTHIDCPSRPLVASSPTEPAPILPPDAPKSHPELAAECPHCPPNKDGSINQHYLKDCPTLNKPPEVEKPAKAKRGRPRKVIVDVKEGETEAEATARAEREEMVRTNDGTAPKVAFSVTLPEGTTGDQIVDAFVAMKTAVAKKEDPAEAVKAVIPIPPAATAPTVLTVGRSLDQPRTALQLYVDAEPGPGVTAQRLEPYVSMLTRKLAELYQCDDIRGSDHKALGFTKWKGALAAAARANPPPAGAYLIRDDPEFGTIVVKALEPFCAPGFPVRGVR